MPNPLFQALAGQNPMIQQFQQFKRTFKGNPEQTINQMLQSGQITQEQVNKAMQMANQFKGMLPK